ncbi:interferon alpha/beta receptor 2-like [Gymnodraco acuticeps]|uniref:Interferon alpha/beta receptor 2-like n=1 Tax=Gymnodraco acuticeps TaxID=8218 RepID=A0A6P8UJA3_GYMAC|nr:interferon alpha/beta receptor 2-like [Gymnodraco acuticeps]
MTALLWMLALLPRVLLSHVLPAMIKLPLPVNINLTSSHFKHELRWEPGPGTPTGVYYQVAVKTDTGTIWVPVASCQHVQSPLVCNLTEAFPVRDQLYFTSISALLDSQPGEVTVVIHPGFEPIKNTALDLPLLTVTPCGQVLCVDPRPPVEHLRAFYDNLHYKLRIQSNNANNAQSFMDTQSLERVILKDLASGRQYCVSVRISDVWASRKSNYSQPVCAFTLTHYTADPWISAFFILLVICALVVLALMLYTGSICLTQRPLPSVLRSIHHIEERTVVPSCNSSLSSRLNLEPAAPPSGEKSSCHSSDESDEEESVTETPRGRRGGGWYQVRGGSNPLSSSSSSSGSAPLSPQPLPGQTVRYNTSPPAETCTSAGLHPGPPSPTDTHCSTIGTKVQGGGGQPGSESPHIDFRQPRGGGGKEITF